MPGREGRGITPGASADAGSALPTGGPGRHPESSLHQNFSWMLLGSVVYTGCQWGMLVALAKLGTPEVVGRFALALAITAPVIMLTNLNLRAVQATDARRDYQFGDYLALRLVATVLALVIIAGISIGWSYNPAAALVILAVGLAKAFEAVSDVFYGVCQQRENMDRIAKSVIIRGPLSLTALGVVFYLTNSLMWSAAALAATWALVLLSYDISSGRLMLSAGRQGTGSKASSGVQDAPLRPRWRGRTLARLAYLALPLGFVMMLVSLNANIPRYFVERFLGERELGIFAAMTYLMVVGATVVNALGQSSTPRLAKHYADGDARAFYSLLLRLVCAGALAGAIGVLLAAAAGRWILTVLYRPEYAQYTDVFIWLAAGAGIGFVGSFLGYGVTATRAFSRQSLPYSVVTIVAAGSAWFLVSKFGLIGAAWTVGIIGLASCVVPVAIMAGLSKRRETP